MRTRRFEGEDAAGAVLAALEGIAHPARVVLQLRIVYESALRGGQRHMCEVFPEGERTLRAGDAEGAAEIVDGTFSLYFTYRGRISGGKVAVFLHEDDEPLDEPTESGGTDEAAGDGGTDGSNGAVDAMDLRMRRAFLGTTLAVDADASWDRGVGTCVYDFLLRRFGAVRDVKRGGVEPTRGPAIRAELLARLHAPLPAQPSFTSCLPKLRPLSRPLSASGAAARPCATVSR